MTNLATMRPMLACSTIPRTDELKYPLLASPKLDGIRCLMVDGLAMSRNMKRIPNKHVFEVLKELKLHGLDGELMLADGADFNSVQSAFMSESGEPNFVYNVFDDFSDPKLPFVLRAARGSQKVALLNSPFVRWVHQEQMSTPAELETFWATCVEMGYEGVITKSPSSQYKFGRSTFNQQWMMKLKTFSDAEAVVIGYEEMLHNANDAEENELGYTKRSHAQDGMVATDMLGALVVRLGTKEFKIGTGFTMEQRQSLWLVRKDLLGTLTKFKYQELSKYGIPRFPVWLGFRNQGDLS
jgi:DNA ligase 1